MRSILAIGAHPDDIEIGCGGTLAKFVANGDQVTMLVITDGRNGPGDVSERKHEQENAANVLGVHHLVWGNIPDCEVSLHEKDLVGVIERVIKHTGCDLILTHSISDSHQDHVAVARGTLGAARHCPSVLAYDAPSSIGFEETVFVDISDTIDKKVEALKCHASQVAASPMVSSDRERAKATVAGHHARRPMAEGFQPVRMLLCP
jgi:LmbE family N-acetylglucosaminyl deacetylase